MCRIDTGAVFSSNSFHPWWGESADGEPGSQRTDPAWVFPYHEWLSWLEVLVLFGGVVF